MEDNKVKIKAIRIGFLGDSPVGKTAIIYSILGLEFSENIGLTITDKYETKFKLKNNEDIKLIIFDTAGQERFKSIAFKYMFLAHGIILTFDFTRRESFAHLSDWLEGIKENLKEPLIILFGNKVDIDKNKWTVTSEEVREFAGEKEIAYFETSAKTGEGINEGLSYIVNKIYNKLMGIDDNNIMLNQKPNNNSNCAASKKGKNNKK